MGTVALSPMVVTKVTSPSSNLNPGTTVAFTVRLSQPVSHVQTVQLSSTSSFLTLPGGTTVDVAAGESTAVFFVDVSPSFVGDGVIRADFNGSSAARAARMNVYRISTFTFANPTTAPGGSNIGTITLNTKAASTVVITLSNIKGPGSFPATVTILAGSESGTFVVSIPPGAESTRKVIKATLGASTKSGEFAIGS